MDSRNEPFRFEYLPTELAFGRGCVGRLGATLAERGHSRALLVCGRNVGANEDVMAPVRSGLGDRLRSTFARTTPEKRLETVFEGAERIRDGEADCVVAVGGGSSINVAKAMCLVDALDRPPADVVAEIRETGRLPAPDPEVTVAPNVVVPTTLPGADLSDGGGISRGRSAASATDAGAGNPSASFADRRLMPTAVFYDPALVATTPDDVLAASAMNGFDKGVETIYSRASTPISRAHAVEGLRYLRDALPELRGATADDEALHRSVLGTALVQYGCQTNLVHAFGNGVSDVGGVHQGIAHGVVAPVVLRYVFDNADAERHRLAEALGVPTDGRSDADLADAIVERVTAVARDLHLPERLRELDVESAALPAMATAIVESRKHARNPPGVSPSREEVLDRLRAAW